MAMWRITRVAEILVAGGALTQEFTDRVTAEIEAACTVRSRTALSRHNAVGRLFVTPARDAASPASIRAAIGTLGPAEVVAIGQALRIETPPAPSVLHFLSLVRRPAWAVISVAIRMLWADDGSSFDAELRGAGPQQFGYDQLGLTDDRGQRYRAVFEGDGEGATWQGVLRLEPAPPSGLRWLDLIADGTKRLIRLDLARPEPVGGAVIWAEPADPPGTRLLAAEAEQILISAFGVRGPAAGEDLGEIVRVLTEAGVIGAGSPVPGQLAALCRQLGITGPELGASPAAPVPGPWASVLAQRAAGPFPGPEIFAPLGTELPEVDEARFVLTGLSSAEGRSYLHVAADRLRLRPGRPTWWLRDSAGDWHLATEETGPSPSEDPEFRLRLTPRLRVSPDRVEVVLSGDSARVHAIVPVRGVQPL